MNKKFIIAALAGFLTVCGFAVSAQEENAAAGATDVQTVDSLKAKDAMRIFAVANSATDLASQLTRAKNFSVEGLKLGYLLTSSTGTKTFVSLADAIGETPKVKDPDGYKFQVVELGEFKKGDSVEFGLGDPENPALFTEASINVLNSADAGYHTGYNAESFYQLDFSEMPFDGKIDVLVVGEPLPGSTVTLILSLAALAIFLGYARRRQSAHAVQEL